MFTKTNFILLTLVLTSSIMSDNSIFKQYNYNEQHKDVIEINCIKERIRKYEHWRKYVCKLKRKRRNKLKHATEGNRNIKKSIYVGWLNDKVAAKQRASSVRYKFDLLLKKERFDILGISEANIWQDEENANYRIRGYDIIPDMLYQSYGRARSALYIFTRSMGRCTRDGTWLWECTTRNCV